MKNKNFGCKRPYNFVKDKYFFQQKKFSALPSTPTEIVLINDMYGILLNVSLPTDMSHSPILLIRFHCDVLESHFGRHSGTLWSNAFDLSSVNPNNSDLNAMSIWSWAHLNRVENLTLKMLTTIFGVYLFTLFFTSFTPICVFTPFFFKNLF